MVQTAGMSPPGRQFEQTLESFLEDLRSSGRHRRLRVFATAGNGRVAAGGRQLLNFSSNDYLGLARHPALIERARRWAEAWGTGATASRLVCGTLELHQAVEEKLAKGKGAPAALIFNSGFQANSAVLAALFDKNFLGGAPLVFSDRLNHASIHHGCKAAGARQIRYRHNDMDHLQELLQTNAGKPGVRFIVTETVFSMDGDRVDVDVLSGLAKRYGAFLYLDEAHATGVFGRNGFGLAAGHSVDLVMGTFSKGLGGFGAYVACSGKLREYLINRCSGFIYSTALPPAVLGAIDAALDLLPSLEAERQRLLAMAEKVRHAFRGAGIDVGTSSTQIIPAIVGSDERALSMAGELETKGILGVAVRPPSVPQGASRIRFALSAAHSDRDIERLIRTVGALSEGA
jgi:8-amino-7-oxononanoate synthase